MLHSLYYQTVLCCTDKHTLFIHPSAGGHLGCFQLWVVMNNAAINICMEVFVWACIFISLGKIVTGGIAWSDANSIFKFLRNYRLGLVAHTYKSSFLGSGDQEDYSLRPAVAKSWQDPISTNKLGMVVQTCFPSYAGDRGLRAVV
jgi:hypothetical protein